MDTDFSKIYGKFLSDNELAYELRIRGLKPRPERANRLKSLNRALQKNLPIVDNYELVLEDEVKELKSEFAQLDDFIKQLGGTPLARTEPRFKEGQTRIVHLTDRIERLLMKDNSNESQDLVAEWRSVILEFESDLLEKTKDKTTKPLPLATRSSMQTMSFLNASTTSSSSHSVKSIPVHKWGLKFDGRTDLIAFLEKVNDLMIARHVSENEVFSSAYDLFEGPALTWFRSVRDDVSDWDALVALLKSSFLPSDNDDALWDQIRVKRQLKGESVVIFVAEMNSLFNRLTDTPVEKTKLKFIMKNLLPHYISALALEEINSISDLLKLSKKLDEAYQLRKQVFETSNVTRGRLHAVENDPEPVAGPSRIAELSCWNCRQKGHSFRACNQEPKRFCFRCGKPDVTVRTCDKCSPHSGN